MEYEQNEIHVGPKIMPYGRTEKDKPDIQHGIERKITHIRVLAAGGGAVPDADEHALALANSSPPCSWNTAHV